MKKTKFWLAVCLLVTMFTFTGCGNQTDKNNDAIPDDQQNQTTQQDVGNNGDGDARDEMDDDAEDIKEGVEDATDDVKDALDGDDDNEQHNSDKNQNDTKQ